MTDVRLMVIRRRIVSQISNGKELSMPQLQAIIALILGATDTNLIDNLLNGSEKGVEINKNIKAYKAILYGERPQGEKNYDRDKEIARDFSDLRKMHKADIAYEILSKESKDRYKVALSIERIKGCVTNGRKIKVIKSLRYHQWRKHEVAKAQVHPPNFHFSEKITKSGTSSDTEHSSS